MSIKHFTCFLITFFLSAWSLHAQYYYIANNDVSNLYFENQGEIRLGLSLPLESQNNIQLGYSPLKHLSISAAFHRYSNEKNPQGTRVNKSTNSSFTLSGGSYVSLKNSFEFHFFVLRKLKTILIQGNAGYSINKNNNIFSYQFPHNIKNSSQGVFFRMSCFIKYQRLSFGISRQLTFVSFKKAEIIGDYTQNPSGVNNFESMLNSNNGQHRLRDYTLSIRYKIKGIEAFYAVHSIDNPTTYDLRNSFYLAEYTNIGLILPIDLLFKSKNKDLP